MSVVNGKNKIGRVTTIGSGDTSNGIGSWLVSTIDNEFEGLPVTIEAFTLDCEDRLTTDEAKDFADAILEAVAYVRASS